MLAHGDIVAGKFRIERLLAQGGMGAVFAARHLETERRAALKVLWPDVLNSELSVEKFQLEAKVAALVQSDHIVNVLDAGFDEERAIPYLAMELLEGCTLRELPLPLPASKVALYLAQLSSALDKAHGYLGEGGELHPIIHCDLKPENVFLTHRDSGVPEIKILDFGMARMERYRSTRASDVRGTPLYMAVEQIKGEPLSPQTDIWALGLISFFLLTGRPYWRAGSSDAKLTSLLTEILSLPLLAPSKRGAELGVPAAWPEGYDAWFLRCVHREPSERFASAGEAARAFASVFGAPAALHALPSHLGLNRTEGWSESSQGLAAPRSPRPAVWSQPTERLDSAAGEVMRQQASQALGPRTARGIAAAWAPARARSWLGVGALAVLVGGAILTLRSVGAEEIGTARAELAPEALKERAGSTTLTATRSQRDDERSVGPAPAVPPAPAVGAALPSDTVLAARAGGPTATTDPATPSQAAARSGAGALRPSVEQSAEPHKTQTPAPRQRRVPNTPRTNKPVYRRR